MNKLVYIIEDQIHAEIIGEFESLESAQQEIQRIVKVPFGIGSNRCPCTNWNNCKRSYELIKYNKTRNPWNEISRKEIFSISRNGIEYKNKNEA